MRKLAALAAALLLASCYDPEGQCAADAECLADQVCGVDGLCVPGTRPPPGDPPVAQPDTYPFAGSGPFTVAAPGVLSNDSDPDGAALTAERVPSGTTRTSAGGTVYLQPDGGFVYAPPVLGYVGADAFDYRATNGVLGSAVVTVSLSVGP